MRITITRTHSDDQGTFGILEIPGKAPIKTVEPPWRDNKRSVSCIPTGEYQVNYMKRSAGGKFHDVYHVLNVPGRSGILIHIGNFAGDRDNGWRSNSWGCILPALKAGMLPIHGAYGLRKQRAGLASKMALARIHAATGREAFTLEIRDQGEQK